MRTGELGYWWRSLGGPRTDGRGETATTTMASLRAKLRSMFPSTADVDIDHARSGVLGVPRGWCVSVNANPASGPASAGGYVGEGVAAANLAGRNLRDLILEPDRGRDLRPRLGFLRVHPDPNGPPDLTPLQIGEVWTNPVTRERSTILELPDDNPEGRATAELTALIGARVVGEHRHPGILKRFTVIEGELTVKQDGRTSVLHAKAKRRRSSRMSGTIGGTRPTATRACGWKSRRASASNWMIETLFGLARLGHTNGKGMPHPLQLAVFAREFSDTIVFRKRRGRPGSDLRRAGPARAPARVSRDVSADIPRPAGAALGAAGGIARSRVYSPNVNPRRPAMAYETLLYDTADAVATITLNRPERLNTIVPPMPEELETAVHAAIADAQVKVIVLRGAGRAFCAGFDFGDGFHQWDEGLTTGGAWDPGKDFAMATSQAIGPVPKFMSLWRSPKPVIAQVHGWCVGGGSDMALCADLVIASEDARIGTSYSRMWGCYLTGMWLYRLGLTKAKEYALTGRPLSGVQAVEAGLINAAVPFARLEREVAERARQLAAIPLSQLAR